MHQLWDAIYEVITGMTDVMALLDSENPVRRERQPAEGDFERCVTFTTGAAIAEPDKPGVGIFLFDVLIAAWVSEGQGTAGDRLCSQIIWPIVHRFDTSVKHGAGCALVACTEPTLRVYSSRFDTFEGPVVNYDPDLKCWRSDAHFMVRASVCSYSAPAAECT